MLDLPMVNLIQSKPLYFLENVTHLNLEHNLIDDFEEQVAPILMTLQNLENLKMAGNPVVKLTAKYRD